jgi:hypothetical protein
MLLFNTMHLRYGYPRCKHDTNICFFPYRRPLSNNAPIQTFWILASCHREQSGQLHMSTSLSSRKLYKMEAHDRDVTAELYTPRSRPRLADTYQVVYCIKVLATVMNSSWKFLQYQKEPQIIRYGPKQSTHKVIIIKYHHGIMNFPYMAGTWTQIRVKLSLCTPWRRSNHAPCALPR